MNKKTQYLVEGITKDIITYLMKDMNLDISSAIDLFYNSKTYQMLCNPETGLYIESPKYVYEVFKDIK